ncbi:MAG: sigma-70 family RNA polymerase sigma factor [Planctomycetes bacterium]|nr:sigma-70 family RNA polymerase sigma factor [Planctomycetota bacterium]MBI3846906.1 sigma-70 family RNA polymerase sigma factor [Planctomycetota bacterium]
MKGDPDLAVVREFLTGDPERKRDAIGKLYEKYQDRAFNTAYRITGDFNLAKDVIQDSFVAVWEKLPGFRTRSKFSSWLYRIVVNYSIERRRRVLRNSRHALEMSGDVAVLPDGSEPVDLRVDAPDRRLSNREFERKVQAAIDKLSPRLRPVVVLRYIEDRSYKEIGEILRCSIGTVKSRLNRAHAALEPLLHGVVREERESAFPRMGGGGE